MSVKQKSGVSSQANAQRLPQASDLASVPLRASAKSAPALQQKSAHHVRVEREEDTNFGARRDPRGWGGVGDQERELLSRRMTFPPAGSVSAERRSCEGESRHVSFDSARMGTAHPQPTMETQPQMERDVHLSSTEGNYPVALAPREGANGRARARAPAPCTPRSASPSHSRGAFEAYPRHG